MMIISKMRITNALISLRGCAGWSAPLLFVNPEDRFSRVAAHYFTHTFKDIYLEKQLKDIKGLRIIYEKCYNVSLTYYFFLSFFEN